MNKKKPLFLLLTFLVFFTIVPCFSQVDWAPILHRGISTGKLHRYNDMARDSDGNIAISYSHRSNDNKNTFNTISIKGHTSFIPLNYADHFGASETAFLENDNSGDIVAITRNPDGVITMSKLSQDTWVDISPPVVYKTPMQIKQAMLLNEKPYLLLYGKKDLTSLDNYISVITYDTNQWTTISEVKLGTTSINFIKAAFNKDGTCYIAFSDQKIEQGKLSVVKLSNNQIEFVGAPYFTYGSAYNFDIEVYNDTPYIVYFSYSQSPRFLVRKFNGTEWEILGDPAFYEQNVYSPKIDIDSSGICHLAYIVEPSGSPSHVSVMRFIDERWQFLGNEQAANKASSPLDIYIDNNDTCYLSFSDQKNNYTLSILKYGKPEPIISDIVDFPDPTTDAIIRTILNKPTGDILKSDLLPITELDLSESEIYSFEGLQYCKNVTRLNISQARKLVNSTPIKHLTSLVELDMSNASIIFDYNDPFVSHLVNLEILNARSTGSQICTYISGLTKLRELNIQTNGLSNDKISPLSNLTLLESLILSGNNYINDLTPLASLKALKTLILPAPADPMNINALGNLTELVILKAIKSNIIDTSALNACTKLQYLDLSYNPITSLDFLNNLKSLKTFILDEILIYKVDPSPIASLTSLEKLSLKHSQVNNINYLSPLTNLRELTIQYAHLTDTTPLGKLSSLTHLSLQDTNIVNPVDLQYLTSLEYLNLENNKITEIHRLKPLTRLTYLNLSGNYAIVDTSPLSSLVNLKELYINTNTITDVAMLKDLTSLEILELQNNRITDIAALSSLINLTKIDLRENQIQDLSPLYNLDNLTHIELRDNQVTSLVLNNAWNNVTFLHVGNNDIGIFDFTNALNGLDEYYWFGNNIATINFDNSLNSLHYFSLSFSLQNISMTHSLQKMSSIHLSQHSNLSDISFLKQFTKLSSVFLRNNNIKDLSPLFHLKDVITSLDVEKNGMLICNDGGLGSSNLEFIQYLRRRLVYPGYKEGNIADDIVDHLTEIAVGKKAVASSTYTLNWPASAAVDGRADTVWASAIGDDQWIYVDLGQSMRINAIGTDWYYHYYAKKYEIYISDDLKNWTKVYTQNNGIGGSEHYFGNHNARYVGLLCSEVNDQAYGLSELRVRQLNLDIGLNVMIHDDAGNSNIPTDAAVKILTETGEIVNTTVTPASNRVGIGHYAVQYRLVVEKTGYQPYECWLTSEELVALHNQSLDITLVK